MSVARIGYDHARNLAVTVEDVETGEVFVRTRDVAAGNNDRDRLLHTIEPYGWVPGENGPHPDAQILDVHPTHVCPQCQGCLVKDSAMPYLVIGCACGWTADDWAAAMTWADHEAMQDGVQ